MIKKTISRDEILESLKYDGESGQFTWKKQKGPKRPGDIAGSKHAEGYVQVMINGSNYLAHRLAWVVVYGEEPDSDIDHKNGIRNDNRISNLRIAERFENMQNTESIGKNGKLKGSSFNKRSGKYESKICHKYKTIHLGEYETEQEAHEAYLKAKIEIHKFQGEPRDFVREMQIAESKQMKKAA